MKKYKKSTIRTLIGCVFAILISLAFVPLEVNAAAPFNPILNGIGGDRGIAASDDGSMIAVTENGSVSNSKRIAIYKNGARIFTGVDSPEYISKILIDPDNDCIQSFSAGNFSEPLSVEHLIWYKYKDDGTYDTDFYYYHDMGKGSILDFTIDPQGKYLYTLTVTGGTRKLNKYDFSDFEYVGDIPLSYSNKLNPQDIAVDSKGNIYVVEQAINSPTTPTSYFWKRSPSGTWKKYTTGVINGVYTKNIEVDHIGRVYINFRNSGIVQFTPKDADGTDYYPCEWIYNGSYIQGIALDKIGNIYANVDKGFGGTVYKSDYAPPTQVIKPGKPKVSIKLYGHDDIQGTWDKQTSPFGTIKYKVEYKKSTWKKYTVLSSGTTRNYYRKANLDDGARYRFKITPYVEKDGNKIYGAPGYSSYIYTLKKIAAPMVSKSSANYVRLRWTNIYGESGYEIARSRYKTKSFTTLKRVSYKYSTTTAKTTRNVTYYYKIRAYRTVDGKRIYAPWSAVRAYKLR